MDRQDLALKLVREGKNLFVTGNAGTGKSTLLRKIRDADSDAVVVAPTGMAAINVGGLTVHSLFMIKPSVVDPEDLDGVYGWRREALRDASMIILDEISMVRVDLLNLIDYRLRDITGEDKPFGGKQIVMFGDMCQLPPVVSSGDMESYLNDEYGGPYFFLHPAIRDGNFHCVELDKIYRQTDQTFIDVLNSIREGRNLTKSLEVLSSRVVPSDGSAVFLTATNYDADKVNEHHLVELPGDFTTFAARVSGTFPDSLFPTELHLHLKVGARVMTLRNDSAIGVVNGSLGTILELGPDHVILDLDGKKGAVRLSNADWINYKLARAKGTGTKKFRLSVEPIGTFHQMPLRLAWAMTIHKSQGQTFDKVHIDMGKGAFAHGQTYVGLSRCRTMEGLSLSKNIKESDIQVDPLVLTYRDHFEVVE